MNKPTTTRSEPIIPPQSKSLTEMTPWEISQIDAYQNRNRGFYDDCDELLENFFSWED